MESFQLSAVAPGQAGVLADISRDTFVETFAPFNTPENMHKFLREQFTREQLMGELGLPGLRFTLAWDGSLPAGYLKTRIWDRHPVIGSSPSLEISRIYTRKAYWGTGLGKLLMRQALDEARLQQVSQVWLGVWEKNDRAMRFYEKWGFVHVGNQEFRLGDDLQKDWILLRENEPVV